jgi:hypothetical protein
MGFRQKLLQCIFVLFFALKTYPVRLYRIILHFLPIRYKLGGEITVPFLFLEWFISLILYVGDLVFLPEIICILYVIINKNIRGLTPKEKQIKHLLFEYKLKIPILLNDKANVLTKNGKIAFVSFYIINSTGMSDKTFAHELIHIYQFSRYGSPYIIRALLAQRTSSGYDYGGDKNLLKIYENNLSQGSLNYEQQGDVLADYYMLIKNKDQLDTPKYLYLKSLYDHIVNQWLRKDIYRW